MRILRIQSGCQATIDARNCFLAMCVCVCQRLRLRNAQDFPWSLISALYTQHIVYSSPAAQNERKYMSWLRILLSERCKYFRAADTQCALLQVIARNIFFNMIIILDIVLLYNYRYIIIIREFEYFFGARIRQ